MEFDKAFGAVCKAASQDIRGTGQNLQRPGVSDVAERPGNST